MSTLPRLIGASLDAPGRIRHGFYGRRGGVSTGVFASLNGSPFAGDLLASVDANRRRVRDDLAAVRLFTNQQIHGNHARIINADTDPDELFQGDGLVTGEAGLALGVLTADCAPVLFADPHARVIGVAHAGWKGALLGATDAVIERMAQLGAQRARMVCAIGPAIQRESYRVGAELVEQFQADSPFPCAACFRQRNVNENKTTGHGDWHFDLPRYLRMRIARAGIASITVLADDPCTDVARFFSYRRSCQQREAQYGRQMSAIVLA